MAHPVFTSIGGNLLVRTGIVAAAILIAGGIATGTLPVRCLANGMSLCSAKPAAVAAAAPQPAVKQEPAAAAAVQVATASAPVPPKPTLTSNDVLAATFAMLPAELQKPVIADEARPPAELTTRRVKAISIKPDGTPVMSELVTEAYAAPVRRDPVPSPAVEAAARIGAGEPPVAEAELTPAKPAKAVAKPAAKSSGGASGTIKGKGANIRSSPTKGKNQVLFTLPGGEQVRLGERSHGWVKITDDQGRSGWVYGDFVG